MDAKILIIGAGAAGIAAGTRLMAAGFTNVGMLEAEQRIGGRVNTIPYGRGTIDMGAQWCHGQKGNVVWELAKDHDLLEPSTVNLDGIDFVQSDGNILAAERKSQLLRLMDILDVSADDAADPSNAGKSLGDLVNERYAVALLTDEYKDLGDELASQFQQTMHRYNNGMMASDSWFALALRGYVEFVESAGNQMLTWKGAGYAKVFDLLLREIPDASQRIPLLERIEFGKRVCRIEPSTEGGGSGLNVRCSDDTDRPADHVIWTPSLGVLQAHHQTIFAGGLSTPKVAAIRTHALGTVAKMYLEFADAFWPDGWDGFTTLWRPAELQQLAAADKWLGSVSGVYQVEFQPNMLCGWISGPNARRMAELPEAEARDGLMRVVRMFLPGFAVKEPISFKRSQWNLEPNFLGSYSYEVMEMVGRENGTRADLAEPQRDAEGRVRLQFAGEATSKEHYGTVHGAIETGWREADRLIDLYKDGKGQVDKADKMKSAPSMK